MLLPQLAVFEAETAVCEAETAVLEAETAVLLAAIAVLLAANAVLLPHDTLGHIVLLAAYRLAMFEEPMKRLPDTLASPVTAS